MPFGWRSPFGTLAVAPGIVEGSGHRERRRGMRCRTAGLTLTLVGVLAGAPAAAGQGPPDPPGPYVLDVRGVFSGLPAAVALLPPLAAGVPLPTSALGLDIGGHVYAGRLGAARLGFGANLLNVRSGTFRPSAAPSTTSSSQPAESPGVRVDMRTLEPQMSFNFGTADGWSYLSGGAGFTEVTARVVDGADVRRGSGWVMTINAGGGARWFLTRRVAFGFDARLHRVAAADTMPSSVLFSIGAGISLR